jgi:hypothetical protein
VRGVCVCAMRMCCDVWYRVGDVPTVDRRTESRNGFVGFSFRNTSLLASLNASQLSTAERRESRSRRKGEMKAVELSPLKEKEEKAESTVFVTPP